MNTLLKRLAACTVALTMLMSAGCGKKDKSAGGTSGTAEDSSAAETLAKDIKMPALETVTQTSDSLYVKKVDGLTDSFIMGADISSVISLEKSGVKYYDYDGKEADIFEVLKASGVNYIRVRVWNDPKDSDGNGYGGGNCDIDTAVEIGKRATAAGLRLLVDFHYSDFWADPAKQMCPKAWKDMEIEEKKQALYDYTADCMKKLNDAGVDVGMVQLGNETNGAMCGEKIWMNIYYLMDAGSRAVRESNPDALIAVHFTNPESTDRLLNYASKLDYYHLDYDVFASSYYPYWHGTPENLTSILKEISDTYGKKVMCAETSWAYTLEDGDGSTNNIGDAVTYEKPYPFTVQGQSRELRDVIEAIANVGDAGIGVFYWEPAWLPVPGDSWEEKSALWEENGAGWAASYSVEYDPDDAGLYYGGCSWENQAMFDFEGKPLESLKTFALVREGNVLDPVPDAIKDTDMIVRLGEKVVLPDTVPAIYTDGSEKEVAVKWEDADLEAMSAGEAATYTVKGVADGMETVCRISMVEANYVTNYSFEDEDRSMWVLENKDDKTTELDFQQKQMDAVTGEWSVHFWGETGTDFELYQEIKDIPAGKYTLAASVQGGFNKDGEPQNIYVYLRVNGEETTAKAEITEWAVWDTAKTEAVDIPEGAEVTVGIHVEAGKESWGTIDDFLLNPVDESKPSDEKKSDGKDNKDNKDESKTDDSKTDSSPSGGSAEVANAGFEDGESSWTFENIDNTTTQIDIQQKADDAYSGENALHFWGENGTKFRAYQKVAAAAGTYDLAAFVQGGFSGDDNSQNLYIYCSVNGTEYTCPVTLSGWSVWQSPVISGIVVPEGAEVIIGIYVEAGAQSWGTVDDFALTPA
ncbi:arabinogalactan endo-1,4-beta-galactosidase [Ruminococcus sp. YE71]|uniref:glycosyl hydrolase 53 family protein n=1 Tax=unclassified Ruminococcus TaxID=2608920 RepID=UPI00088ECC12|nr:MULTISPECIES: glycosyl hydrolase 53 family protein [unclassified Ruminococcus]SDA12163.1 arabinogalactan endo-1,4-beta-galactosidase [Ruminococcus sp. YE78]SFW16456.1 arabinogalactan endo-1,4-beta-galactosidase [Ruminococcus sp. YE71]